MTEQVAAVSVPAALSERRAWKPNPGSVSVFLFLVLVVCFSAVASGKLRSAVRRICLRLRRYV